MKTDALHGVDLDFQGHKHFHRWACFPVVRAGYVGTIELILLATIGEWTGHGVVSQRVHWHRNYIDIDSKVQGGPRHQEVYQVYLWRQREGNSKLHRSIFWRDSGVCFKWRVLKTFYHGKSALNHKFGRICCVFFQASSAIPRIDWIMMFHHFFLAMPCGCVFLFPCTSCFFFNMSTKVSPVPYLQWTANQNGFMSFHPSAPNTLLEGV